MSDLSGYIEIVKRWWLDPLKIGRTEEEVTPRQSPEDEGYIWVIASPFEMLWSEQRFKTLGPVLLWRQRVERNHFIWAFGRSTRKSAINPQGHPYGSCRLSWSFSCLWACAMHSTEGWHWPVTESRPEYLGVVRTLSLIERLVSGVAMTQTPELVPVRVDADFRLETTGVVS